MSHTLTNIEKEINSYLFPCPPQLRWKSHRPPSHRHTPCFIGSSLQVFLHRHTPCFIGSSLQASSLPSSASTITPPTSSATPESKSTFPLTTTSHRQPSLQADFHRLLAYTVILLCRLAHSDHFDTCKKQCQQFFIMSRIKNVK